MSLLIWCLGLVASVVSLIISVIINTDLSFRGNISQTLGSPEESLLYLNYQINSKSARLKTMLEKISEIKKAILELEAKSGEIHLMYNEKQKQLRSELSKSELECQSLRLQIKKILKKRDNMKKQFLQDSNKQPTNLDMLFTSSGVDSACDEQEIKNNTF